MDELTAAETSRLLANSLVGHIAVVDDGLPYVSPVSYVMVGEELCFRTGAGRRINALRKNPAVSIEVMLIEDGRWESVIASGTAREVTESEMAQIIVSKLLTKYADQIGSPLSVGARSPVPEPGILVAVTLDEVSGRSSGSWFSIPTRPGRL